ncbi:MAG: hypothetical protein E3J35_00010 [Methanomassiliicoccales archaeon]|nr:MAG: hypothetical protein E3J35_00010 [Methanomassiliicoccales archaeon]
MAKKKKAEVTVDEEELEFHVGLAEATEAIEIEIDKLLDEIESLDASDEEKDEIWEKVRKRLVKELEKMKIKE